MRFARVCFPGSGRFVRASSGGSAARLFAAPLLFGAGVLFGVGLLGTAPSELAAQAPDQLASSRAASGLELSHDRFPAPVLARIEADLAAMERFRPGYAFWRHVFLVPDGSVVYGSGTDGSLIATFPARGDWQSAGRWEDGSLVSILQDRSLQGNLTRRRDQVAELLEPNVGPVLHNATRGNFLLPNARRYGGFLEEWGAIYERFGVPAEIGLAQAILESGLNGRVRSEARALGLCQWLPRNWDHLKRLSAHEIEGYNQTTQAPYCAAYLTVLATKYGSFIPALSEHHAGGTNVGRTVINGDRLGGMEIREQYFLGSQFARDVRTIAPRKYREVVRTYGPRSYLYSEMVFGNARTVVDLRSSIPQERIYAMRVPRAIPLDEITRRTGLSADEVRRFNPALVRQVPRGANLYLPSYVEAFGPDVSFWHRPPEAAFTEVMDAFLDLEPGVDRWESRQFLPTLSGFQQRFRQTNTEEGVVMAAILAYVADEIRTSGRSAILAEFRTSSRIEGLFREGVRERDARLGVNADR